MNIFKYSRLLPSLALAGALVAGENLFAQTSTWDAGGGDGLWNTAANWSNDILPAEGTNALIASAVTVNYNTPMAATSVGTVTVRAGGTLNVASTGFVVDTNGLAANGSPAIMVSGFGSTGNLNINSGSTVLVSNTVASALPANWGAVSISTNGILTVGSGSSLNISNTSGTLALAVGFQGTTSNPGRHPGGSMVVNGGTVNVDQNLIVACGNSSGTTASSLTLTNGAAINVSGATRINNPTDDAATRIIIDGATANLGSVTVARTSPSGGLFVTNGTVNMTALDFLTGPSRAFIYVMGGTITNTGTFIVGNRNNAATSSTRTGSLIQRGGNIYSTGVGGIIICNQGNTTAPGSLANILSTLEVTGGNLYAEQITLNNATITANAASQLTLGGTATIYIGSGGLVGNLPANSIYTVSLTGGTLAPKSVSFGIGADLTFSSGTATIKCADAANIPYDIWMTNVIAGSGTFAKTGGGTFTILNTATHTGTVQINEGKLVLDGAGNLPASGVIDVASGATFDVGPAYTLNTSKTLRGTGTVTNNVSAATGSFIKPASDATIGTLTFTNDLIETGGANNNFDLSTPSNHDKVIVGGTLNLSGVNPINVNFVGSPTVGTYRLFQYNTLVGDVSNLSYGGLGTLTNNTFTKTIDLVLTVERPATNLVWLGDSVLNNWDFNSSFNWTNNGSGTTFKFLVGDTVTFNNQGSTTPDVNFVGELQPAAVTVNASVNYTFNGNGKITGLTPLTKSGSGRLTIAVETNDYTGVTTLSGGTLTVTNLESSGVPSAIGAASSSAANVVLNGGTLEYMGITKSINRPMTLGASGATVSIGDSTVRLTQNGNVTGAGALAITGSGQLSLNTPNDYSGGTTVTAGSIRTGQGSGVNISALGTGNLTLNGTVSPASFEFGGDQEVLTNLLVVTGNNNFTTNNGNNTVVTMTGSGTLTLEGAGGSVFTFDGNMSTFSGTIVAGSLGNPRFHPSSGSALATFDLGTGTAFLNNRNGGITYNIGALIGGPSTQLRGASTGNNPSTYSIGGKNISTTFDGSITDGPLATRYANILKVGTGTFTLTGPSTYTGTTTVSNGVLAITGTASIDGSRRIAVASPGVLDVTSHTDGSLTIGAFVAQTLGGVGQVWGSITNGPFGTIAPGFSIGTLEVTNGVGMQAGSTTLMEIVRPSSSDKLVSPALFLDGNLIVTNVGALLQIGDTFDLFDGPISGTFASITLPNYYTWSTANLYFNGTISVTGVLPPPQISGIVNNGTDVTLTAVNGAPNGTVVILSSTDLTLPLASWTQIASGAFDGSGNFTSNPIAVNPGDTQRFYVLLAQ